MKTIQYNATLAITSAVVIGSYKKKNIPRIRFGDSSKTTFALKTLLFLQNTKITVSEVSLLKHSCKQYVM